MKKILLILSILVFFCIPVKARDAFRGTILETTRLDDDPTSVTSDALDISQYDKIVFWVTYDETEAVAVSGFFVITASYDNVNYEAVKFYDYDHPTTLQQNENFAVDKNYYCWWNRDLNMRYVKVGMVGIGTDASDLIDIKVTYSAQK